MLAEVFVWSLLALALALQDLFVACTSYVDIALEYAVDNLYLGAWVAYTTVLVLIFASIVAKRFHFI